MTPKEKAKELVNTYLQIYDGKVFQAKQCAIIAIELALEYSNGKDMYEEFDKVLYLIKTRDEIKKLWQ